MPAHIRCLIEQRQRTDSAFTDGESRHGDDARVFDVDEIDTNCAKHEILRQDHPRPIRNQEENRAALQVIAGTPERVFLRSSGVRNAPRLRT